MECETVLKLVEEHYQLKGTVKSLGGFLDLNFLLEGHEGKHIVKLSKEDSNFDLLHLQNAVLEHFNRHPLAQGKCDVTKVKKSKKGLAMTMVDVGGSIYGLRVLSYVQGIVMWDIQDYDDSYYQGLGEIVGQLSLALEQISLQENVNQILRRQKGQFLMPNLMSINYFYSKYKNTLATWPRQAIAQIKEQFNQYLSITQTIPKQLIHNDICFSNVLVKEKEEGHQVCGIIDFGNLIYQSRIIELVTCCARINMNKQKPFNNLLNVIVGYNRIRPLTNEERTVILPLIKARLATLYMGFNSESQLYEETNQYVVKCRNSILKYIQVFVDQKNQDFQLVLDNLIPQKNSQ